MLHVAQATMAGCVIAVRWGTHCCVKAHSVFKLYLLSGTIKSFKQFAVSSNYVKPSRLGRTLEQLGNSN